MENLDEAAYTQRDDRCIPPSIRALNSSMAEKSDQFQHKSNNQIEKSDNNQRSDAKSSEKLLVGLNLPSECSDTPDNAFLLSVDNLERIKKERQIMEQTDISNVTTIESSKMHIRTSSPTVKLEVKSESSLITDALNTDERHQVITDKHSNKDCSVKTDPEKTNITIKDQRENDSSKNSNSSNSISTKSEYSNHKSEKEDRSKTFKEQRYCRFII